MLFIAYYLISFAKSFTSFNEDLNLSSMPPIYDEWEPLGFPSLFFGNTILLKTVFTNLTKCNRICYKAFIWLI